MAKRGRKPKRDTQNAIRTTQPAGRGRRGPRKTPAAKLKLHGSRLAKDRTTDDGQQTTDKTIPFPNAMPDRPAWCKKEAHKIWDELIDYYTKAGMKVLSEVDCYVLARYCDLLAWYVKLRKDIAVEGEIKTLYNKSDNPYLSTNPKAALAVRISTQLVKLENELYLTPAARQGVIFGDKKEGEAAPNSLAEFLARGKNAG